MSETVTDKHIDKKTEEPRESSRAQQRHRSPLLAWVALALTLVAWLLLIYLNGYVALGVAAVAVAAGFAGMPGRSTAVRNLAITAVIAATVLLVVLAAFLIVIKIGLAPVS